MNPMNETNKTLYKNIVKNLKADGNTNLKIPIEAALNQLKNR